jgi:hypothetical protein
MLDQKAAMTLNIRFIAYGAIIAAAYMTIISSLVDITKLIIVVSLVALFAIIERCTPRS